MKENITEAMGILRRKALNDDLTQADTLFAIASGVLHVALQLCEMNEKIQFLEDAIRERH